jgi:hypothetical protein
MRSETRAREAQNRVRYPPPPPGGIVKQYERDHNVMLRSSRRDAMHASSGEVSINYARRMAASSDMTWGHVNTKICKRPMIVKKWSKIWKGPAGKTAVERGTAFSEPQTRHAHLLLPEGLYVSASGYADFEC